MAQGLVRVARNSGRSGVMSLRPRTLGRYSGWVIAIALLAGCQGGSTVVDPFLAPQRVPPPATGQATPGNYSAPYYEQAPPPGSPTSGGTFPGTAPAGMIPPAGSYSPGAATAPTSGAMQASWEAPSAGNTDQVVHFDEQVRLASTATGNEPAIRIPSDPPNTARSDVRFTGSVAGVEPNRLQVPAATTVSRPAQLQPQIFQGPPPRETVASTPPTVVPNHYSVAPPVRAVSPDSLQSIPRSNGNPLRTAEYTAPAQQALVSHAVQPGKAPTYAVPAAGVPAISQPPRRFQAPQNAVEITELPPASARRIAVQETPAPTIQEVAATVPSKTPSTPVSRYGYQTEYQWLKGKLELIRSSGQWKLRYIPIDGDTDRYGGSVVIANPDVLADHEPGDYVAIAGQIASPNADSAGFAPEYVVERVKTISR